MPISGALLFEASGFTRVVDYKSRSALPNQGQAGFWQSGQDIMDIVAPLLGYDQIADLVTSEQVFHLYMSKAGGSDQMRDGSLSYPVPLFTKDTKRRTAERALGCWIGPNTG